MAAEVEHRSNPLEGRAAEAENGDAAARDGLVDASPAGQGAVEAAGESDGGGVRDLVLHGGDRANPAADQGRGGAGEQVSHAGRGARAGVEDHKPRYRPGLAQQVDKSARLNQMHPAVFAGESDDTLVMIRVEVAVADEVHHVPLLAQQRVLEICPGGRGRPHHRGQSVSVEPSQRPGQLVLFLIHVQGGQAARGGHNPQDAQRRGNRQRRSGRGHTHVTDQLVPPAHVRSHRLVVHGLPRQAGQGRIVDPQDHAQPFAAVRGQGRGGPVPSSHFAGAEQGPEERVPDVLDPLFRGKHFPGRDRGDQHCLLELATPA